MEFFVHCRDRPGSAALRAELTEEHWSFMDAYADGMIARGPTLSDDGLRATGSVHAVDLPDLDAARVFAFEEPNQRAGVYEQVTVRRWRNLLGATMWELARDDRDAARLLVIAHAAPGAAGSQEASEAERTLLAEHPLRERLVVCGPLLADDGVSWLGNVFAVERASREAVEPMAAADAFGRAGLYGDVEVHRWCFGGRR